MSTVSNCTGWFWGLAITALACYGVYRVYDTQKKKLIGKLKSIDELNENSVSQWIGSQDLESYSKEYTAIVVQRKELPKEIAKKVKLFGLTDNIAVLCIYDKGKSTIVKQEIVYFTKEDESFKDNDFVEVQF